MHHGITHTAERYTNTKRCAPYSPTLEQRGNMYMIQMDSSRDIRVKHGRPPSHTHLHSIYAHKKPQANSQDCQRITCSEQQTLAIDG